MYDKFYLKEDILEIKNDKGEYITKVAMCHFCNKRMTKHKVIHEYFNATKTAESSICLTCYNVLKNRELQQILN